MAFSYVGPAALLFIKEDGAELTADVSVTLLETMPGLFKLNFPYALPAAQAPIRVRVTLPDSQVFGGLVHYLTPSSLTFSADASGSA